MKLDKPSLRLGQLRLQFSLAFPSQLYTQLREKHTSLQFNSQLHPQYLEVEHQLYRQFGLLIYLQLEKQNDLCRADKETQAPTYQEVV